MMLKYFALTFLALCSMAFAMNPTALDELRALQGVESLLQKQDDDTPYPFTRDLDVNDKPVGVDVYILKELLRRYFASMAGVEYLSTAASMSFNKVQETYTDDVAANVYAFQSYNKLTPTGIFDKQTARKILPYMADTYKDTNVKAESFGMKYKIVIPVKADRNIETIAYLFDSSNAPVLSFLARTHGKSSNNVPWPSWDEGPGLTEFAMDGNTPTGLSYIDFNTPEPDDYVDEYGPYEVNRITTGIMGNAAVILPNVRNGILIHTGNWDKYGWDGVGPMPNSSGCIHVHPEDAKKIAETLKKLGVVAHENPFGQLPYPFKPQGLISIFEH